MPGKSTPSALETEALVTLLRMVAARTWVVAAGGIPRRFDQSEVYVTECPAHPAHAATHVIERGWHLTSFCPLLGQLPPEILESYVANF